MGTTSEKIAYLYNTKNLLKNRLKSIGAEITSETTFRNYLSWLDTFYNSVSNKTDLHQDGIVGRTSQENNPSPASPKSINTLTGDCTYRIKNKNLFNFENVQLKTTANFNGTADNVYSTSSFNTRTYVIVEVPSNTEVTISTNNNNYSTSRYYISCLKSTTVEAGKTSGGWIVNTGSILTTSDTKYLGIVIDSRINGTTQTSTLDLIKDMKIQVEESTTPTKYEPGILQNINIPLGDIELCEINTFKDKIYSNNGKFYLEKNIGKAVLDGTETITITNSGTEKWYYKINITSKLLAKIISAGNFLCTHYENVNVANGNSIEGFNLNSETNVTMMRIRFGTQDTVANYKNWLANNNCIVYGPLATPTTTEITSENYPALYSSLVQIQDYLTSYKINSEFVLDYSSPNIEY